MPKNLPDGMVGNEMIWDGTVQDGPDRSGMDPYGTGCKTTELSKVVRNGM